MAGGAVITSTAGTLAYAHLLDPNRTWKSNRRLIALNGWIVLMLITSSTNGYDGSMMNGLQAVEHWQSTFNYPAGGTLGLFNAIQTIGSLASTPFAPYMSDIAGRRAAIFLGAVIMCVATAIQTASSNFGMFIAARFLIGFGLTFAANAAPMLVTEVSYPKYRTALTSLYNSLWFSGSIVAAWATFGTFQIDNNWSWRIPSLLQGVPSIFQVCLIFFAPESPRFLVSKGKEAQALKTLAYYHADGNDQDPLVQYEFQEICAAIELDRTVAHNVGWKSLFTTPGNLKRMRIIIPLAFFSQWSGNGLVSYYLTKIMASIGITNPTTQLLVNGLLQIWNLFWAVGASFLADRLGRRLLFLTSVGGMTIFFAVVTACSGIYAQRKDSNPKSANSAGTAAVAFIFLFNAAYAIAFTPLIVSYTVEILPYQIRAKGFTVFNFCISLSLIFNQYVNPIALDALEWKYYIFYACWLLFEGVYLYFFLVETKGRTLEETAALFDGQDAVNEIAATAHHAEKDQGSDHMNEKRSDSFHESNNAQPHLSRV